MDLKEFFFHTEGVPKNDHPFIGKHVIVRSSPSGVHFGILASYHPLTNTYIIKKSRRIHYWEGAFTLSEIANNGLDEKNNSRISVELNEISIGYVNEIIPCSEKAIESLGNFPVHKI